MEFLVLAPTPTFPPDLGGRRGIVSLHDRLRHYGRIHFVLYGAEGEWRDGFDESAYEGMRQQWDSFHLISPTRDLHTDAHGEDHDVDEWWDPAIGDYLTWRFQRSQFHGLVVHYTWLSKALTFAPRPVHKVLYTADRFSGRREMFETRGFRREFFHLSKEGEAAAFARADTVIAVKEQEQAYFESLCGRKVITVPHHEPKMKIASTKPGKVFRIGLIGGYNTINSENFRAFMRVAAPIFSRSFAPVRIIVAGGVCDALADFASPYAEIIGPVDRLEDFYESVDAVIIPMEWSSGIKIKYAEGVASGKPVFSTAHAAEGYPAPHPFMRCEDFEALANACVKAAFDPEVLTSMRKQSEKAWEGMKKRLETSVSLLVKRVRQASPTFLIVAPRDLGGPDSLQFQRLLQVLDLSRWTAFCEIFLPANAKTDPNAVRKLQSIATVRTGDSAKEAVAGASAIIALGWPEGEEREAFDGFQGTVFSFDTAPSGDNVVYFGDRLARGERGLSYDAPHLFRHAGSTLRSWGYTPTFEPKVWVLSSEANAALAGSLVEIGKRWRRNATIETFLHTPEGLEAATRRVDRAAQAGSRPRLVINLSEPGQFRMVREVCERAAVPVVSSRPLMAQAGMPDLPQPPLSFSTRHGLLKILYTALMSPENFSPYEEAAQRRLRHKFTNDAGWAGYWRMLNGIVDSRSHAGLMATADDEALEKPSQVQEDPLADLFKGAVGVPG